VACGHLALAVESKDFVRRCVELSQGQELWRALCRHRHEHLRRTGEWSSEQEDFMWLETAFCQEFLHARTWFGAMDYEWRTVPKPGQGGFWVLLWSKDPQRLWWELREDFEEQALRPMGAPSSAADKLPAVRAKKSTSADSREANLW